jgi:BirA family biotin operon repressor/biotin-[acetyl-CoA-carboxylase] ligase
VRQILFDTIDSTQTYAKQHKATFAQNEITCIIADEQTAGYGRHGRKWNSPKGLNLYFTLYFQLPGSISHVSCLGHLMSATLAKLLDTQIKWPNDILLGGKKVGGILCETILGSTAEVFLGVGLNVNQENFDAIDQPASSLKVETGRTWDRKELLNHIQAQFERNLAKFVRSGFEPFRTFIEKRLIYKGEGTAEGLNEDGGLIVQLNGLRKIVY